MAMSKLEKHAALPASKAHGPGRVKNMRAGGKTNSDMKKYGRGMAKVMNQRKPMRGSSGPR